MRLAWKTAAAGAVLAIPLCAQAQVSGSVALLSDNIFRGRDLSDGAAVPQAGIAYDGSAGWYLGSTVTVDRFAPDAPHEIEWIAYGGLARRIDEDWSVETGITTSQFPSYSSYNYTEAFVGTSWHNWTARVFYSPNYFGQSVHTLYGELGSTFPLDSHFALTAHVGGLVATSGNGDRGSNAFDVELGASARLSWASARLAWAAVDRLSDIYPIYGAHRRSHWVVALEATF